MNIQDQLSPSVNQLVLRFTADVSVPELVDALTDGHRYLVDWPWSRPQWPDQPLRQPIDRWLAELQPVVEADVLFGRLAILGWCLLDQDVAGAAERSGLLGGILNEITPKADDFVTPAGRRLLLRRAPLAALGMDAAPTVESRLDGQLTRLAIDRVADTGRRTVGRWAAAGDANAFVGEADRARLIQPDEQISTVTALGWARTGILTLALGIGTGLIRYDPRNEQLAAVETWPPMPVAMVTEDGIVGERAGTSGDLVWNRPDRDKPVALPQMGHLGPAGISVIGDTVVAVGEDRLLIAEAGGPWTEKPWFDRQAARCVAVTDENIVLGLSSGTVQFIPRGVGPSEADDRPMNIPALPGKSIEFAAAAGSLVAVAAQDELAVLDGTNVVARWRPPAGSTLSAVALSADGRSLGVAGSIIVPTAGGGSVHVTGTSVLRIWRIDVTSEVRLTSYAADTPDGEDTLSIQPVVDALAALVVARAVRPPLSVGLFGTWGSGKTFFMRHLEKRVDELCLESRRSGRPQQVLWGWRNVRQVRFNAWNYASADVWAGLLEELLRDLVRVPADDETPIELPPELVDLSQGRVTRLAQATKDAGLASDELKTARKELHKAKAEAKGAAKNLAKKTADAEKARRGPIRDLVPQTLDAADKALAGAGLPALGGSFSRAWQNLETARRGAGSVAGYLRTGGSGLLIAAAVAGPLVTLLALVLIDAFRPQIDAIYPIVAGAIASAGAVTGWLATASDSVTKRLDDIAAAEEAVRKAQQEAEEALRKKEQDVVTARATLAKKGLEQAEAKATLDQATAKVQLASDAGSLLAEYLQGRATSADYRSQLGLIGTVRRDIEVISRAVEQHNDRLQAGHGKPNDRVVNRVVLYIDDLDRCRPEVVVKVLEAVSMLLSYELFVVVVAVDSHWIGRSLITVYPTLLSGGAVTPDSYLEKIFQLPVWLGSPTSGDATRLALSVLGPATDGAGPPGITTAPVDAEQPVRTPTTPRLAPKRTAGQVRDISSATSPPASIVLAESERTDIGRLAPLVARSPRALKRYINTYRLLKSLVGADDLDQARWLLAAATSRPHVGELLLTELGTAADDDPRTLDKLTTDWSEADRQWLQAIAGPNRWSRTEAGHLQAIAQEVRRFVFRSEATPASGGEHSCVTVSATSIGKSEDGPTAEVVEKPSAGVGASIGSTRVDPAP